MVFSHVLSPWFSPGEHRLQLRMVQGREAFAVVEELQQQGHAQVGHLTRRWDPLLGTLCLVGMGWDSYYVEFFVD